MSNRTRVVGIWDAVPARLQTAGGNRNERPPTIAAPRPPAPSKTRSIVRLAERRGLDAVVVLDPGWTGLWSARRVADEGLPVLWLAAWPPSTDGWRFQGVGRDLIVPGLRLRYCPATIWIKEQLAKLDASEWQITVSHRSGDPLWEMLDLAGWLIGSQVVETERTESGTTAYHRSGQETAIELGATSFLTLRCGDQEIEWISPVEVNQRRSAEAPASSGDDRLAASLQPFDPSDYRPATTVLLDVFFRRVAGGLVPVPSIDELLAVFNASVTAGN